MTHNFIIVRNKKKCNNSPNNYSHFDQTMSTLAVVAIHQRRRGEDETPPLVGRKLLKLRLPEVVFRRRRQVEIQIQHVSALLISDAVIISCRPVPSHMASQCLPRGKLGPTNWALVDFVLALNTAIPAGKSRRRWRSVFSTSIIRRWLLLISFGGVLGLFVAGPMAAQRLKRRESSGAGLALVDVDADFSGGRGGHFRESPAAEFDLLRPDLVLWGTAACQKDETVGHVLVFYRGGGYSAGASRRGWWKQWIVIELDGSGGVSGATAWWCGGRRGAQALGPLTFEDHLIVTGPRKIFRYLHIHRPQWN